MSRCRCHAMSPSWLREQRAPTGRCQTGPKVTSCAPTSTSLDRGATHPAVSWHRAKETGSGPRGVRRVSNARRPRAVPQTPGTLRGEHVPTLRGVAIRVRCVMAPVTRATGQRVRRSLAAALLCVATLILLAAPASTQRSRGNFFIYQSHQLHRARRALERPHRHHPVLHRRTELSGQHRASSCSPRTSQHGDVFGPFVVTTDADGRFCQRVNQARPTKWKVDLVEPGSGFTDSKVVTVLPTAPPSHDGARRNDVRPPPVRPRRPPPQRLRRPRCRRPRRRQRQRLRRVRPRPRPTTTTTTTLPTTTTTAGDDDRARVRRRPRRQRRCRVRRPQRPRRVRRPRLLAGQTTTTAATTTAPGRDDNDGRRVPPPRSPSRPRLRDRARAGSAGGNSPGDRVDLLVGADGHRGGVARGRRGHVPPDSSKAQSRVTRRRPGL